MIPSIYLHIHESTFQKIILFISILSQYPVNFPSLHSQSFSVIHQKCLFSWPANSLFLIKQINMYNIMMKQASPGPKSKAMFYRGIPLNEYLRNRSRYMQDLQYKDDDTIFYDQQRNPIFIDDFQIITQSNKTSQLSIPIPKVLTSSHLIQKNTLRLPDLNLNKSAQNGECNATQRNSTDTSNNEVDPTNNFLPTIKKDKIVRERNITMASRSSSRSTSCRKRIPKEIFENQELEKVEEIIPIKVSTNKDYIKFLTKKRESIFNNKLQDIGRGQISGDRFSEMRSK